MLRRYHEFQVGDDLTSAHSYIRKSYEKLDSNNPRFANRAWTDLLQGQPQTDILIEADGRLERGLSAAINLLGATINCLKTRRGILSLWLFYTTNVVKVPDKADYEPQ
jgi:hypothetical protein